MSVGRYPSSQVGWENNDVSGGVGDEQVAKGSRGGVSGGTKSYRKRGPETHID